MAQWFYEKDGKPAGPVSHLEIARLMITGRVKEDTLVWTPSFGDKWQTAREAGFSRLVTKPLQIVGASKSFSQDENASEAGGSFLEALANKQASLSSIWALVLFGLPFAAEFIFSNILKAQTGIDPASAGKEVLLAWAVLLAAAFLCMQKDREKMAEAGYQPLSYWWLLFMPAFMPGYFLLRWERTKKYLGLFLMSSAYVSFAVLQMIVGLTFSNPQFQSQVNTLRQNMNLPPIAWDQSGVQPLSAQASDAVSKTPVLDEKKSELQKKIEK